MLQKITQIRLMLPFLLVLPCVLSFQIDVKKLKSIVELYSQNINEPNIQEIKETVRNFLFDFSTKRDAGVFIQEEEIYKILNEGVLKKIKKMKEIISNLLKKRNSAQDLSNSLIDIFTNYKAIFEKDIPNFVHDYLEPITHLVSEETIKKVNVYSRYKIDQIQKTKLSPNVWKDFSFLSIFGIAFSEIKFLTEEEKQVINYFTDLTKKHDETDLAVLSEQAAYIIIEINKEIKFLTREQVDKLFVKQTDMYNVHIFHLILARQLVRVTDNGTITFFNYKQLNNIIFDLFFFHILDLSMASIFFEILFESLLTRPAMLLDPICSFILLTAKIGNKLDFFTNLLGDLRKETEYALLTPNFQKNRAQTESLFQELVLTFSFLYQQILTASWNFKSAEILNTVSSKPTTLKSEIAKNIRNTLGTILSNGVVTFCKASIEGLVEGFSHAGEVAKNSGHKTIASVG